MLQLVVLSSVWVSNGQSSLCFNLCKDRVREQPGLLGMGVVHAGVSLADCSAWGAAQGEVCAAQQQIELSGSKVPGRALVSLWANVLRVPNALQCWV